MTFLSNLDLISRLADLGHTRQKAKVLVHSGAQFGVIYLDKGQVLHAEFPRGNGLFAFYQILRWPEARVIVEPTYARVPITIDVPVDTALFQNAQLEDQGVRDLNALRDQFDPAFFLGDVFPVTSYSQCLIGLQPVSSPSAPTLLLKRGTLLVGSGTNCDVMIRDPSVSIFHCTLAVYDRCLQIIDRKSAQGTWINRSRIEADFLHPGDFLQLGKAGFDVVVDIVQPHSVENPAHETRPLSEISWAVRKSANGRGDAKS
jgi:hypothetical protein